MTVQITDGHEHARFLRADAVKVLVAAAERVEPPCPYAGPDRCGGCDFQHISLPRQRQLLGDVVREQLQRLGEIDWPVEVEAVPGDLDGLRWRTRMRFVATEQGQPGLRKHRSHEVVAIDDCRIAAPDMPDVRRLLQGGVDSAEAVVSSTGEQVVIPKGNAGPMMTEQAAGRSWQVRAGDFWQVHPGAAEALVSAVLEGVRPQLNERCWDLYAGVGLLTASLAERVGRDGAVVSVESQRSAVRAAETNLRDLPQVRLVADRVERFVRSRIAQGRLDVVVLDPPRSGAGSAVIQAIARRRPRAIAYVACDPATLARDLATLATCGYQLGSLRAFDIFPMTSHVECVAICQLMGEATSRVP
ncbi:MAG: RsmD family RNA methyltransferase [Nocardioidaceae bacterium]